MKVNLDDGTIRIGNVRSVLHCNHYNSFLQNTLVETLGDKMVEIQIRVATKVCTKLFQDLGDVSAGELEKIFADIGLGTLYLEDVLQGKARVANSHYGLNMYYKFGAQKQPVCYLAAGYILAAYNKLTGDNATIVVETSCIAVNPDDVECCTFEVKS